jgi:hypothetical protein
MKLFAVKLPEDAPGLILNGAVVRAERPKHAKRLAMAYLGPGLWEYADRVQVAELIADGPVGVIGGAVLP